MQIRTGLLIDLALEEDVPSGDLTSESIFDKEHQSKARIEAREDLTLCGVDVAAQVFKRVDPAIAVTILYKDGEQLQHGDIILQVTGPTIALLTAERTALNFLQRLSGVATLSRRFSDAAAQAGTGVRIVDTRKTTPGLRLLEKYAVRCGGGHNHRYALDDMILIKDNHIALAGGVQNAVSLARESVGHSVKVEVECDTLDQVREALKAGAELILLDNMPPATLREAVEIVDGKAICEASGGINLQTVRGVAQSGVDVISVGALTHSVRALDVGLDIEIKN